MKPLTLEEAVRAMQGNYNGVMPVGSITRVSTDSRDIRAGDLFVAIRGERFDGHDFVPSALAAGASAAVVSNDSHPPIPPLNKGGPTGVPPLAKGGAAVVPPLIKGGLGGVSSLIHVDDPVEALGRLARYYRRSVIGGSTTVVAVTGSNGKTTTKTMIAHILAAHRKGQASIKSFNNAIGVPLTLLSAEPSDAFLVCEVGTNAPGEIAALAHLIEPDIAVVTSVAEAHLERLGSIERVAEEKLSLLCRLESDGCAVVNADCEVVRWLLQRDRRFNSVKRVTFGEWAEADLRLTDLRVSSGQTPGLEFTVNNRFHYRLNVPGRHNAFNALAAIGVARRFGMTDADIAERLATFALPAMRLECLRVGKLTLINDAYNANPASLAAAVQVLVDTPAGHRRVLIVGDMRELGPASAALHRQAAENIARSNVDLVVAIGDHSKLVSETIQAAARRAGIEAHAYATTALAKRRLISHLLPTDTILIKGSRALGLETLAETIREWAVSESNEPRASARAVLQTH